MVSFAPWLLWSDCCSLSQRGAQCSSGLSRVKQFRSGWAAVLWWWFGSRKVSVAFPWAAVSISSCSSWNPARTRWTHQLHSLLLWLSSCQALLRFLQPLSDIQRKLRLEAEHWKLRWYQNSLITGRQCINLALLCNNIYNTLQPLLAAFVSHSIQVAFFPPAFQHEVVLASFVFQSEELCSGCVSGL